MMLYKISFIIIFYSCFFFFGSVFRTALLTIFYTGSIQDTTNNMITYTW